MYNCHEVVTLRLRFIGAFECWRNFQVILELLSCPIYNHFLALCFSIAFLAPISESKRFQSMEVDRAILTPVTLKYRNAVSINAIERRTLRKPILEKEPRLRIIWSMQYFHTDEPMVVLAWHYLTYYLAEVSLGAKFSCSSLPKASCVCCGYPAYLELR